MNILREGVRLKTVHIDDAGFITIGDGANHAAEIVVTEENGQMASVPWAKVTMNDGRVFLHNLANMESVELLEAS